MDRESGVGHTVDHSRLHLQYNRPKIFAFEETSSVFSARPSSAFILRCEQSAPLSELTHAPPPVCHQTVRILAKFNNNCKATLIMWGSFHHIIM